MVLFLAPNAHVFFFFFTLFFDRGTASLCWSFNNQGTGEGHELLNTKQQEIQVLFLGVKR